MSDKSTNRDGLQWAVMRGNRFRVCERTVDRLPAGAYTCATDDMGTCVFEQRNLEVDDLIDFPGSLVAQLLEEIERFWTLGDRFRQYGFLHRRGYLLHGKQGSGKSSLLHLVIARAVAKGHVAFFCESPGAFSEGVSQFRNMDPDRPMLCMFVVISVCCLDKDLVETAAVLKDLETRQPSSDDHDSELRNGRHPSSWNPSDEIPF